MRGDNARLALATLAASRFTPTCVGTMSYSQLAHTSGCGSPPHAWGQFEQRIDATAPAPVHPHMRGDNLHEPYHMRSPSVHPHMRGDNLVRRRSALRDRTVHPHMRGDNAASRQAVSACQRFTPTCVGTMRSRACVTVSARCGNGSPPHAWGQLHGRA